MKRFIFILFSILVATNAFSATQQVTFKGHSDPLLTTNAATEYMHIMGSGGGPTNGNWNGTESIRRSVMPASGTFKTICAELTAAPGAGYSTTFTLVIEAVATALAATISGTDTEECFSTDVSITAGDVVNIKYTTAGTPEAATARFSFLFEPTIADQTVLVAGTNDETTRNDATTEYTVLTCAGCTFGSATESNERVVIPTAGKIKSLYMEFQSGGPGTADDTRAFTLMLNGSASALTCTIGISSSGKCNDTSNEVTVAEGDFVSLRNVTVGAMGANHVAWGVVFQPTTSGEFISMAEGAVASAAATDFQYSSANETGFSTEANRLEGAIATTVTKLYAKLSAAPNTGKSRSFTLRLNGDTSQTFTISDAGTTGSSDVDVSLANLDLISIEQTPTSTPDAATAYVSIVGFFTPTSSGAVTTINSATINSATIN